MKTKIIIALALLIFTTFAFSAPDRVIDPEIPIDDTLLNNEEHYDDILLSLLTVILLSLTPMLFFLFMLFFGFIVAKHGLKTFI